MVQPNLGVAHRYSESIGDFIIIQLAKKTEHENFSIGIRQFGDFTPDALMRVFVSEFLLGR